MPPTGTRPSSAHFHCATTLRPVAAATTSPPCHYSKHPSLGQPQAESQQQQGRGQLGWRGRLLLRLVAPQQDDGLLRRGLWGRSSGIVGAR